MMQPLSIPAVTTLNSTDAVAIRQIVSALIQAIDSLRKDVEELKVSSKSKPSYDKFGVKR
jgi:hypothetical protein